MRTNENYFSYLEKGENIGVSSESSFISGLAGKNARLRMQNSMVFGVEKFGQGYGYYMVDNPLFRGIWQPGLLLFANAIFFEGH